jgi:hypothetical protein
VPCPDCSMNLVKKSESFKGPVRRDGQFLADLLDLGTTHIIGKLSLENVELEPIIDALKSVERVLAKIELKIGEDV